MSFPSDAREPHLGLLRDADGDAERAAALLAAPLVTLIVWRQAFGETCRRALFEEGAAYVEAVAEAVRRPRHRGHFGTTDLDRMTTILAGIAGGRLRHG